MCYVSHLEVLERSLRCKVHYIWHGLRPDGKTKFRGMAGKLGHCVAISWDGRVIRHCTSVSCLDGIKFGYVIKGNDSLFLNHLYGTFTAAKEKIVRVGLARCAASCHPRAPSSVNVKKACKKRGKRDGRRSSGGGPRVGTDSAALATKSGWPAVELAYGETVVELPTIKSLLNSEGPGGERQFCSGKRKRNASGWKDEAAGGGGGKQQFCSQKQGLAVGAQTPRADGRKEKQPPAGDSLTFGDGRVQLADLEVGGRYKIPKKPKK